MLHFFSKNNSHSFPMEYDSGQISPGEEAAKNAAKEEVIFCFEYHSDSYRIVLPTGGGYVFFHRTAYDPGILSCAFPTVTFADEESCLCGESHLAAVAHLLKQYGLPALCEEIKACETAGTGLWDVREIMKLLYTPAAIDVRFDSYYFPLLNSDKAKSALASFSMDLNAVFTLARQGKNIMMPG